MKILINANFKALRTGDFVVADTEAGEFLFDSETAAEEFTAALLSDIADANKVKVGSKDNKDAIVEKIITNPKILELPVMSEKTDSQKVAEIVAAGVEAGKDDDSILIEIVQSGIKFKVAGKLFNKAMQEGGYRITTKERKAQCREILVEAEFAPETYDEVEEMLERMIGEVNDTTTSQAFSIMKSYAKEFEIELPKPAKKPKGTIKTRAMAFIAANLDAGEEQFSAWIEEQGKKDPKGRMLKTMVELSEFAKDCVAAAAE